MDRLELKEKANNLPLEPGVYLMRDASNTVIYVGKAKKLKNRVSQYFQDTASHTMKTRLMVSKVDHFDVIVASSEFEALVLECSLIKQYQPKYNILLKDDKGYPYLRLDMKAQYPAITLVAKISDDGAEYFGPFGSRSVTADVVQTINQTFGLPSCSKKFPREIGKERPCLHYHMNQCAGWCQPDRTREGYVARVEQARQLLMGHYKTVAAQIRHQMQEAAENLNFELAASLRDRLRSVEILGQKQLVTAAASADTDVIGFAQTAAKACFAVLHFQGGNLLDKYIEILPVQDDPVSTVSSLVKQYYLMQGFAPKMVLLPFMIEDRALFSQLLEQENRRKTVFRVPQRGDNVRLVELAHKNALEEANRVTDREAHINGTLVLLGKMLDLAPPKRIESFDISNISGTDIVASMVVFCDGRPKKSAYRSFKINDLTEQDAYASMQQALHRRFTHFTNGDSGFDERPDLLLIDGGENHAAIAEKVLREFDLAIPVFGMVKDDRHRTRALITAGGREIRIDSQQSVFAMIGNIQEETHRFAISYHRKLRSKRLRYSELDGIEGVGPKRKQDLLRTFKSLSGIAAASLAELERVLPRDTALSVYKYFMKKDKGE